MRLRYAGVIVAALFCVALAGCGSGSNVTAGSGLHGSYSGTYLMVEGAANEAGTLNLTIGSDGSLAGTLVDGVSGLTGTIAGTVLDNRQCTATIVYPTRTVTASGTLAMSDTDRLVGVLNQRDGTGAGAGSFSIDCVPN